MRENLHGGLLAMNDWKLFTKPAKLLILYYKKYCKNGNE